jgi:hypothetical protein
LPKTERWKIIAAATLQRFVEGLGKGARGNERGISDVDGWGEMKMVC